MEQKQPKQVIVVRKDLNMRKGKIAAQVAHASLKAIIDYSIRDMQDGCVAMLFKSDTAMADWLFNESFKKIVCYVECEKDLDLLYENAKSAGIPCALIIDNGLTEFNGVHTKTCVAVGPDYPHNIDTITGHLPLL